MSILVNAHNLSKEFAGRNLFSNLSFGIDSSDHLGLIGPNGAGKSSLLKIIAGVLSPDGGKISRQNGLRVGYLEQDPTFPEGVTVFDALTDSMDPQLEDWEKMTKASELISKLSTDTFELQPDTLVAKLSGGWKKKVAIAREWAKDPDLLLMDEPTNHLDVETILWLEETLAKVSYALVVVTHDRLFLQKVTNRIIELDRRNPGGLLSVQGTYADYLEMKEATLSAAEQKELQLKNKFRRESEWLRRGPKARTTKQQARINRAYDLEDEVAAIQEQNRKRAVNLDFKSTEGGPKKLIEAVNISKSFGRKKLFDKFSMTIMKGARIGLLGANGCGKSTLIRTLLGEMAPDSGEVKQAEHLQVAYFEQNRSVLDPEETLLRSICPQGDHVKLQGNFVHIRSYLDRFLFSSHQANLPVKKLSGGEQARILIARLMLLDANILVLDEPTNDLDVATLDLLEDQLRLFEGAIFLVTHDRYFLDQVCTQILAFDHGHIERFADLAQWESWHEEKSKAENVSLKNVAKTPPTPSKEKKKLSYKEQKEFDEMEKKIHSLEAKMSDLVAESTKLGSEGKATQKIFFEISTLQSEIEKLYARWSELENLK